MTHPLSSPSAASAAARRPHPVSCDLPPASRPRRPTRLPPVVGLVLVLLVAVLRCGDGGNGAPPASTRPAAAPGPANVLLFVVDALRDDAIDCARYRERTPALCGLADRGTRFTRAYAAAPWTMPSSVALLTGVYPSVYARPGTADIQHLYRVPQAEELWVERLVAAGYRARTHVENGVAFRGRAFQGFENVRYGKKRLRGLAQSLGAAATVRGDDHRYRAPLWLHEELARGEAAAPFLLLHWIDDPHAPYAPPEALAPSAEGLPRPASYYRNLGHLHRPHRGIHNLREVLEDLSADELAHVRELYLAEVTSVDERIGAVLAALERVGLADSTYVVVTADHGEGFGEHGAYLHGVTLYEEMVRVPLIVAGPRVPPGHEVGTPVSHVDLVPTLADWLGVPLPGEVHGESLARWLGDGPDGAPAERRLPVYLSSPDRLEQEGVVVGYYKLVAAPGERRLIDLATDPAERVDLAAAEPERLAELEAALRRVRRAIAERRREVPEDADAESARERQETEEQLRAVGYVD